MWRWIKMHTNVTLNTIIYEVIVMPVSCFALWLS